MVILSFIVPNMSMEIIHISYLVVTNLKFSQKLFQIIFTIKPGDTCKCSWTKSNATQTCCLSLKTECHKGCVCELAPEIEKAEENHHCCYCNCQQQGGGTQNCHLCQCGNVFKGGLAYCKPCDCVNGICFNYNNTDFPVCCENCDCGFTDVIPGMNIITEVVFYVTQSRNGYS